MLPKAFEELPENLRDIITDLKEDDNLSLDLSSQDLENIPEIFFEGKFKDFQDVNLDYNELVVLPERIQDWKCVKSLSLSGNSLSELPISLALLTCLEELLLDENSLSYLPHNLGELRHLKVLSLIGNQLKELPTSMCDLHELQELYLDENDLQLLTFSFENLTQLEKLEASNNKIEALARNIGCACKLKIISLNNNNLSSLPESISELMFVEILDISGNEFEELPDTFPSSKVLVKLLAENNGLKVLPKWCNDMPELEELFVGDNGLTYEPFNDQFCQNAKKLKILEAGFNFVETLSVNFGMLSSLESIHFGSTIGELERSNFQRGNQMHYLPDSFCELTNLTKININENHLQCLPDQLGDLVSLTWLDLGQNMIRHLPPTFCELRNLEFIQFSKNKLEEIPEDIGNLQKLIELRLDTNLITTIPNSLGTIKGLVALDLFNNKLDQLPQVIFQLKKLTRLDLDQNNFNMSLDDIPKITPGIYYPERDPSLEGTWRGRSRALKVNKDDVIEYQGDGGSDNEGEDEIAWNTMALKNAINRGGSFWRSHMKDGQERRPVERTELSSVIEAIDDWVPLRNDVDVDTKPSFMTDLCEEDWDEEIKVNDQYNTVLNTCDDRKTMNSEIINDFQNTVNRYPPSKQAYSATAFYDSYVYKRKNVPTPSLDNIQKAVDVLDIVAGQFDDVEE